MKKVPMPTKNVVGYWVERQNVTLKQRKRYDGKTMPVNSAVSTW
jgi:hypothetical protein